MIFRKALNKDLNGIISLIQESAYSSCSREYTPVELNAWVPKRFDLKIFSCSLIGCFNLVAVDSDVLVGFISVTSDGYINRLFTHSKYQNRGIATNLLSKAEKWGISMGIEYFTLDSSLTAKHFYLNRGYSEERESFLKRDNVKLKAILMKKRILTSM